MDRPSRLRLLRLANPFVRAILRSPAHRLLDGGLLLLTYEDPRERRLRTIPVMYLAEGGVFLVLAAGREHKRWWRAFRADSPATLRVAGRDVRAHGTLVDPGEAPDALRAYLRRFPRAAGTLGATADASEETLAAAADKVAIVAFELL